VTTPRILYIASSGIRDPLIVSQVIRYLKGLRKCIGACHLLTLERSSFAGGEEQQIREQLAERDICWSPLPSFSGKRSINLWREIYAGYRQAIALVRQHDLNIIHARSFIPGNIALRVARKTGAKFVYDMRGFWAEEKFAKGTIRWRWMQRQAQRMEDRIFHSADALVSLTDAGKQHLQSRGIQTPIEVIPCCTDTDLFAWDGRPRTELKRMISVGSLGPGYLPSAVFGVYAAAQKLVPDVKLQLLTRTERSKVDAFARAAGCDPDGIQVTACSPEEVPGFLAQADVGLCMIQPSFAKTASSPTKLAEYFSCGLPAIGNCKDIGDMSEILLENRTGADVAPLSDKGYSTAVANMLTLLQDESLSSRCCELAKKRFSLEYGVAAYARVYEQLHS